MKVNAATKLLIAAVFSALALIYEDVALLLLLLGLNVLVLLLFRAPVKLSRSLGGLFVLSLVLITAQSILVREGEPLFRIGSVYLLTTDGVYYGLSVLCRFLVLFLSALLLATCSGADLVVVLTRLRLPYEIVFMILLGIRFVPVLAGEIQNTLNAIQLRGVDLRKVYKRKVIKIYVGLFAPIVYTLWKRAENLAIVLELRGFRKYRERAYYRRIVTGPADYVVRIITVGWFLAFLYFAPLILRKLNF